MKYQPLEILDKNINPQLKAKSLVPQFQNKILKGITFDSIILNEKSFYYLRKITFHTYFFMKLPLKSSHKIGIHLLQG